MTAVMADDQHGMGILRQIAFQPQGAFEIEIVGRFVQQEVIGLGEQDAGQSHPHPPTAREIRARAQLRLGIKTQTLQNRRCTALGRPCIDIRQPRLADIDAWSAEGRASAILKGLGFDAEAQLRPCSDFSGGWRMRVALAGVLFAQPDYLLLDEPTNYLDLEGALWLESYLAKYPHTVLIISHDRGHG